MPEFVFPGSEADATEPVTDTQDDLGVDIACVTDPDRSFSLARGRRNLGMALARRLMTPRGGLFYDPDYGLDLRSYLNAGITSAQLASLAGDVEAEVLKDERVEAATVAVQYLRADNSLKVTLRVETGTGPFRLVLAVSAVTVELLDEGLTEPA